MAKPERMRNITSLTPAFSADIFSLRKSTISHAIINTTHVRIAVAKSELMFFSPILDRIAVIPANTADSMAAAIHILSPPKKVISNVL